jgi:hypothetical protein
MNSNVMLTLSQYPLAHVYFTSESADAHLVFFFSFFFFPFTPFVPQSRYQWFREVFLDHIMFY